MIGQKHTGFGLKKATYPWKRGGGEGILHKKHTKRLWSKSQIQNSCHLGKSGRSVKMATHLHLVSIAWCLIKGRGKFTLHYVSYECHIFT